ncbi:hypothetical protein GW17_00035658 [Ensete ventricosum]|nr:hypothetical protein GW17_00035658 [Ensete ventricosum]
MLILPTRREEIALGRFFARRRRIARAKSSVVSRFFFSLFFFLPPSTDIVRNRPPMIEIDCYRSISGGSGAKTTPIDSTAR